MKKIILVIIVLFCIFQVISTSGQVPDSLLPAPGEIPGWKISQQPKTYTGDQLFELIDGGADIYLEYGFLQVISVQYTDPSLNNIQVEIYEMSDDDAAYGIFSITQQMSVWSQEFGEISAVSDDYISFLKSRYYISISWSSRQRIEKPLLTRLANLIAEKIPGIGDKPELLRDFNDPEDNQKIIYLKGNLGLSNFYYFDYKDIFQMREGLAWPEEGFHRIILKYLDEKTSAGVAVAAKQSISNNKRYIDVTNTFQGFSCTDNKSNEIILRQVDNYIVLLVRLNPDISLAPEMDRVALQIENLSK